MPGDLFCAQLSTSDLNVVNEAYLSRSRQKFQNERCWSRDWNWEFYRALAWWSYRFTCNAWFCQCNWRTECNLENMLGHQESNDINHDGSPRTIQFCIGMETQPVFSRRGNGKFSQGKRMGVKLLIRMDLTKASNIKKLGADYNSCICSKREYWQLAPKIQWAHPLQTLAIILDGKIIIHVTPIVGRWKFICDQCGSGFSTSPNSYFQHTNEGLQSSSRIAKTIPWVARSSQTWWLYKFEVYYSKALQCSHLNANGAIHFLSILNSGWVDSSPVSWKLLKRSAMGEMTDGMSFRRWSRIKTSASTWNSELVGSIEEEARWFGDFWYTSPFCLYSPLQYDFRGWLKSLISKKIRMIRRFDISPTEYGRGCLPRDQQTERCMQEYGALFEDGRHFYSNQN